MYPSRDFPRFFLAEVKYTYYSLTTDMLNIINTVTEELVNLLKDDPVRPEIPAEFRVDQQGRVFVLTNDQGEPLAVTCVKFLADIPETVEDLQEISKEATTAVFYTIWSYAQGAGRELITAARSKIQQDQPEVTTFVTLSPKTEMARRFHLKNGAEIFKENQTTVNYLYR